MTTSDLKPGDVKPRDPLAERLSFLVALLLVGVLAMVAAALVMRLAA